MAKMIISGVLAAGIVVLLALAGFGHIGMWMAIVGAGVLAALAFAIIGESGPLGWIGEKLGSIFEWTWAVIALGLLVVGLLIALVVLLPNFWGFVSGVAAPLATAFILVFAAWLLRNGMDKEAFIRFSSFAAVVLGVVLVLSYFWTGGSEKGKAWTYEAWFDGAGWIVNPAPEDLPKGKYEFVVEGDSWTGRTTDGSFVGKVGPEGDPLDQNRGKFALVVDSDVHYGKGGEFETSNPSAPDFHLVPGGTAIIAGHFHVKVWTAKSFLQEEVGAAVETGKSVYLAYRLPVGILIFVLLVGLVGAYLSSDRNANLKKLAMVLGIEAIILTLDFFGGWQWVHDWSMGGTTVGEWLYKHSLDTVTVLMAVAGVVAIGGAFSEKLAAALVAFIVITFVAGLFIGGGSSSHAGGYSYAPPRPRAVVVQPTPAPAPKPKPRASISGDHHNYTVVVPASSAGWYCPGLRNAKGKVSYTVTGQVNYGVKNPVGPRGDIGSHDNAVLSPTYPVGAALVSVDGKVRAVGFGGTWGRDGGICFAVNDSTYADNEGTFVFKVSGAGVSRY